MSKRQSPNEAHPIVQRVRMRYRKTGRMRFGSARDFQRALERSLRRAEVPVAMSGGFNPHPRISYANAAPTGAASLAEYVEIGLAQPVEPETLTAAINDGLPDGFAIIDAVVTATSGVADALEASQWRIELPGRSQEQIRVAIEQLHERAPVTVPRLTKSGTRDIAVTDNWVAAQAVQDGVLLVTIKAATPTVRPADIVRALELGDVGLCTRLAQGPLQRTEITDPLR